MTSETFKEIGRLHFNYMRAKKDANRLFDTLVSEVGEFDFRPIYGDFADDIDWDEEDEIFALDNDDKFKNFPTYLITDSDIPQEVIILEASKHGILAMDINDGGVYTNYYPFDTFSNESMMMNFLMDFRQAVIDSQPLKDGKVSIEGMDEIFDCKLNVMDTWNGWQKPYFKRVDFDIVIAQIKLDEDCADNMSVIDGVEPIDIDGVEYWFVGDLGWIWSLETE